MSIVTHNFHLSDSVIINHPVHILGHKRQLSPSSFIPFCEFGGNMSIMGVNIDQFDVPVCNSFQAKIFNDQLCYEVDLNRFRDKDNLDTEYKSGFAFILDYNEDRQVTFDEDIIRQNEGFGLVSTIAVSDHKKHAYIYLDTIGI